MATRNISLTDALDQYVQEQVEGGAYQNASEVVRDALRLLKVRHEAHAAKVARFNAAIQEGRDAYARGDFIEVDVDDLDGFLRGIEETVRERVSKQRGP